ncbi:MAG TPA: NAD(P)-dependent oxidoreductase [Candidatus Kryptonia bacterium]
MNIALFAASGKIGSKIMSEALRRGHKVTAIVRNPAKITSSKDNLVIKQGNVLNAQEVASLARGHDAVVSAYGPNGRAQELVDVAHSLLEGVKMSGVKRLIMVGGAGSLEVSSGKQLMDTPQFPAAAKPYAVAHRDAMAVFRMERDLQWTFVSPSAQVEPGEKKGSYRTSDDRLLTDEQGKSTISTEDYAAALVDELEHPQHIRRRFTVGY